MNSEQGAADYFAILDILQSVNLRKNEYPIKELILFHSLHGSIYYAVWYGLFDTLEVLCDKLGAYQS